jgi:hypothetical protein
MSRSFQLVCTKEIEAGDDAADPILAFKSKCNSDAVRWLDAFFALFQRARCSVLRLPCH